MKSHTERLRVRFDFTSKGAFKPRYLNDVEIPDWENGPEIVGYLQSRKDEGWSLVYQRGDEYVFERNV